MKKQIDKVVKFLKSKNFHFYARIILISFLPIFTAMGVQGKAITSWNELFDVTKTFFSNPYLIGLYITTLMQSFKQSNKENCKKLKGGK